MNDTSSSILKNQIWEGWSNLREFCLLRMEDMATNNEDSEVMWDVLLCICCIYWLINKAVSVNDLKE